MGYERGADLILFDYDWRQDIASTSLRLKDIIDKNAIKSPTGKVSIVAHSMGSLIVKKYLEVNEGEYSKINNIIFAGSPQLGAPKAFNLLNFGENMGISVLNPAKAKEIAQNMPSAYQLLPSKKYLSSGTSYLKDYRGGKTIGTDLSYDEINNFMLQDNYLDKGFRNPSLLQKAELTHQGLDEVIIDGPKVHNIIGCSEKTLVELKLYDKKKVDIKLDKGDGTVPLKSARHGFAVGQTNYYAKDFNHFDLVSSNQALSLINSIILNQDFSSNKISTLDTICDSGLLMYLFITQSPVNLTIYNSNGEYTGLNQAGDINLGIEGSDYMQVGENNFALVPGNANYRVHIDAYATGSFDFKVRILGDEGEDSAQYLNIPITSPDLNAETMFSGDLNSLILNVDKNGDGNIEDFLSPHFVIMESGPTTIEVLINNIEGANRLGWLDEKARNYLMDKLNLINKLALKGEEKDEDIREILSSLIDKVDSYLRQGLINERAYGIIKRGLEELLNG